MTVPLRSLVKPGDARIEPVKDVVTGPPEPTVYFAYGYNMSTARLKERLPSSKPIGIATLAGHALRFHKRSQDGSGKCNAFETADSDDTVVGVLFSFDPSERAALDKAEGVGSGYEHAVVTVINDKGRRRKVLTYKATSDYVDDSLKPYDWYKEFVLAGALEHGLPARYVDERISSQPAIEDPNVKRSEKQRAVLHGSGR
ncbi:gamma-glutamylcyclotransferase family protein [Agrobacterium tumefaciens]|uniref:gamma-glutamylcyclotransferase family protein n=1 Tax=Agrobacterium tumefaciens TaxID=358 RepID=UPI001574DD1C|nr:gamma-glutamylcyclotransferase family protein [Agrobacterium tumefaciens]WCK66825.1 gamma-glutamylcyclotransferase [Agrobacterium tumefaciens]